MGLNRGGQPYVYRPLRGSIVLEYIGIDLTLEAISVEVIGTIIDCILEVEGHSFKGIAIYKVIHARDNPSFQKFLEKYNKL